MQSCRECGAGAPLDAHFCPQCTKILPLQRGADFFGFLGLPRKLNIDPADLERRFRALSRQFHPDYFYNATPAERRAYLAEAPPVLPGGKGGIKNGLYSIHIRMLDGIDGGNTGVMMLHDGRIRGGDALFDYIGAYSSANGRWKGEIVNREHTPSRGERPVFGGHEVGIGFSGTYDHEGAEGEATALAGKRSIRFKAVLRKLVAVAD